MSRVDTDAKRSRFCQSRRRGATRFWYIFEGEPQARDGHVDLDETVPGLGLTINEDALRQVEVTG